MTSIPLRRQPNLSPLDGLMVSDFYTVNAALRGEQSLLKQGCGPYLDYFGWTSNGQYADALRGMFYDLWWLGALGRRCGQVSYRACTFGRSQLARILEDGILIDHGHSFGTPDLDEAISHLAHDDPDNQLLKRVQLDRDDDPVPVVFQITLGRDSLYLPGPNEDDPFALRPALGGLAPLGVGEDVLDRHSVLRFTRVGTQAAATLVCATQIL